MYSSAAGGYFITVVFTDSRVAEGGFRDCGVQGGGTGVCVAPQGVM